MDAMSIQGALAPLGSGPVVLPICASSSAICGVACGVRPSGERAPHRVHERSVHACVHARAYTVHVCTRTASLTRGRRCSLQGVECHRRWQLWRACAQVRLARGVSARNDLAFHGLELRGACGGSFQRLVPATTQTLTSRLQPPARAATSPRAREQTAQRPRHRGATTTPRCVLLYTQLRNPRSTPHLPLRGASTTTAGAIIACEVLATVCCPRRSPLGD